MTTEQTINLRPPMWLPIIAVIIGGSFYLAGKNMEKQPQVPAAPLGSITVTGEGKVSVVPDIAEASFGLDTGAQPTAAGAMKKLSDTMNKIYDALQAAGIDKKDISTENFSLNPSYDWNNGTQILRGYQATESLRVKVRKMDTVSDVVGAATTAGANQAGSVSFTVDNPDATQADARAKAIDQAKAKAQVLAQQLGVTLGSVQAFNEGGGYQPPVMMDRMAIAGMTPEAKSIPLPAGQQDVTVDVSITYQLK